MEVELDGARLGDAATQLFDRRVQTELHRERVGGGGRLLEPLALDHLLDGRRRGSDRSPPPPPFVVVRDLPSIRLQKVTRDRVVGIDGERLLHLVGGFAVAALGRLANGLVEERFGALDQTGVGRPRCRSTARILAHHWCTSRMKDAFREWYLAYAMGGLRP